VKQIEQAVLGRVYGFAIAVRRLMWLTLRPKGVGVRTLVIHNDQVLLIRHRAGATPWGLPGGGISRYERMIEAARREVLEETGVAVTMEYLLGLYDNFHDGFSNYIAVYVAKPHNEPRLPRSLEIAEVRYFPLDATPDTLDPGSRRRIDEYMAGKRGISALW
jgi:8-oxo-dGTP diphosphatase